MNSNEKTIIQINFNLFNLYKDDRTIIKFEMMDKERGLIDKNNIIKYEVNLELIYKKYYNKEKLTDLEKKLLMIVLKNRKELEKISKGVLMEKVNKRLEELSDDKYAWMLYDREERMKEEAKLVAEYEAEMKYKTKYKTKYKQMEQQFREKLEKKERQIKEKLEKERNIEIAKSMLFDDVSLKNISKYTGLSIKEKELLK